MKRLRPTNKELRQIQDIWSRYFHAGTQFEGGNTEQWYHTFMDFIEQSGAEVVPGEVRQREELVLRLGKSQEYLAALAEVVDHSPKLNDYEQAVMVLTATPEERAAALEKVVTRG